MSLFFERKFLFEADGDDAGGADAATSVDTGDSGTPDTSGDTADTNTDDTNNDNNDNNEEDDGINVDDNDDDFSIDSEPDMDNGDDNNDDQSSAPSSSGDNNSDEPVVSDDSLKAKDGDMFDSLEPAEQEIKLKEMKTNFMNLYQICDDIIDKVNSISKEFEEASEELKRIVNTLFATKKMISDYLLHIFDSKSYVENDVRYTEYLAIVNAVKNIIKDFEKGVEDTNSTS